MGVAWNPNLVFIIPDVTQQCYSPIVDDGIQPYHFTYPCHTWLLVVTQIAKKKIAYQFTLIVATMIATSAH